MVAKLNKLTPETLTLFIILDGFRHDYINETCYLKDAADWTGKVSEPFGFISTRPAMCAGVFPDKTNLCFEYKFNPESTAFSPLLSKSLSFAETFFSSQWIRLGATLWVRLTNKYPLIRCTAMVHNMSFDKLPLFDFSEKLVQTEKGYLTQPTIYDLLRKINHKYLYYGFGRPKKGFETLKRIYSLLIKKDMMEADQTMVSQYVKDLAICKPHFAHLHFSSCDWVGHAFGPDSPQMERTIKSVDLMVKSVHQHALKKYKNVRMLVSADHGMVKVTHTHNIDEILRNIKYKEPDDYLMFQDSTVARFWFFNPNAYYEIKEMMETLAWGKILNDEDKDCLNINFSDNSNGDLFFLLNPGHVLFPNYYQAGNCPPRGMHGYDPEVKDNLGAILLVNPPALPKKQNGDQIKMVDIFPTLADLHDLNVPDKIDGKSIL